MKSNPIVMWVGVIAFVILVAVVGYFIFGPSGVIEFPQVTLPTGGQIVAPPSGADKERAQSELDQAIERSGIEPKYRTDAVVIYPGGPAENAQFIAAPIDQSFDKFPWEEPMMVLFDRLDSYGNGPIAYEVSFSDRLQIIVAVLESPETDVRFELPAGTAPQETVLSQTWAIFVEGSCYIYGCCDSACGYLFCIPGR